MNLILIIDDDATVRKSLGLLLRRAGYATEEAATPAEAMTHVRARSFSLILMDMNYSRSTTGEEGLELLQKVRIFQPETPVILITAWGSIDLAVQGIRLGAFDFITKPWNNLVLLQRIETALSLNRNGNEDSASEEDTGFDRCGIIGSNPALTELLDTVKRIAPTDAPVLILGENGTGKELIANAIHANSRRRHNPFVMVNLGGVPHSLFESEMFGHAKGAFTGAVTARKGRFEMADKGTIFLDEIGDLDMASQVKMLRVLQQHTFEPLGESRPRKVDIRVVCATNADIQTKVRDRSFREDLFYRINLITLTLPALRDRRDDIPALVRHFMSLAAKNARMATPGISAEAMEFLTRLPYPGNIRQLKNMVERAVLIGGDTLTRDLFGHDDNDVSEADVTAAGNLGDMEREAVADALRQAGGNMSHAARILGITRQSLYRRKEKYGL
jgi:two-component system NtrC family response regulator